MSNVSYRYKLVYFTGKIIQQQLFWKSRLELDMITQKKAPFKDLVQSTKSDETCLE